jgi:triacylglycerol lipase
VHPLRLPAHLVALVLVTGCGSSAALPVGDAEPSRIDRGPDRSARLPDATISTDADAPVRKGPPYPIVLVHGFFGFDRIGPLDYFWKVQPVLESEGHKVAVASLDPFNTTYVRGKQLLAQVQDVLAQTGAAKVNLIAHSQGGLDARYVASFLPDRIGAIVTISTPHGGSELADVLIGKAPGITVALMQAFFAALGRPFWGDVAKDPNLKACLDFLSTDSVKDFNAKFPDQPGVSYYSIAGRSLLRKGESVCFAPKKPAFVSRWEKDIDPVNVLFALIGVYLEGNPFDPDVNDGLIHVESAKHGIWLGCIPADHPDEIGQFFGASPGLGNSFDHLAFYRELAAWLVSQGF